MLTQRSYRTAAVLGLVLLCWALFQRSAQAAEIQHPLVVNAVPAANTPHLVADGVVAHPLALAVAQSGDTVFIGGRFNAIQNVRRTATYQRSNLFAFSATNGALSGIFAPPANDTVFAIHAVGASVYVGGEFTSIGGVARRGIAKLDAATGAVDLSFNARFRSGRVSEIRLVNGRLIVSGTFPRQLIALDPATGADTGYINVPITGQLPLTTRKTEVYRFAVNPAKDRLIGVGNFTAVDGVNRQRAFMLTLGTSNATLHPWYYRPLDKKCRSNEPLHQPYLEDVDFSPDGSYFVFVSTGFIPSTRAEIGTAICDAAARFETDIIDPVAPTWINYTGGDTIHSVIATGAAVYVQGHFRWLNNPQGRNSAGPGAVDRIGIGAISSATGEALDWNPSAPAAQGGQDFLATPAGLWAVNDGKRFGGRYHYGIAFFPLPVTLKQN